MKSGQQDRIFSFAKRLVDKGADVEVVKNRLENYTQDDLSVLEELMANINSKDDYSFSFLSDEFVNGWLDKGRLQAQLQRGTNVFLNDYVRNIEKRPWGFIVYKNTLQGENYYSVSFRAQGGTRDVSAIASSLGGGGHKPAAGAKIQALSVQEAIEIVEQAISSVK